MPARPSSGASRADAAAIGSIPVAPLPCQTAAPVASTTRIAVSFSAASDPRSASSFVPLPDDAAYRKAASAPDHAMWITTQPSRRSSTSRRRRPWRTRAAGNSSGRMRDGVCGSHRDRCRWDGRGGRRPSRPHARSRRRRWGRPTALRRGPAAAPRPGVGSASRHRRSEARSAARRSTSPSPIGNGSMALRWGASNRWRAKARPPRVAPSAGPPSVPSRCASADGGGSPPTDPSPGRSRPPGPAAARRRSGPRMRDVGFVAPILLGTLRSETPRPRRTGPRRQDRPSHAGRGSTA